MKRRDFVKSGAIIGAGSVLAPHIVKGNLLYKKIDNDKILGEEDDSIVVILELFGGNDGLNTIIPFDQEDDYVNLRPTLSVSKDKATQFGSSDLWFNDALIRDIHKDGFLGLMDNGQLAVVQGIGYNYPNLSHFQSRDIWHSGITPNSEDDYPRLLEGWLGRYFSNKLENFPIEIPEHPMAIQIDGTVSMLLNSNKGYMGIAVDDPDTFFENGQGLASSLPKFPTPNTLYEEEFNYVHVIAQQSEDYAKAVKEAWDLGKSKVKVDYTSELAQKFKIISSLIAGGLKTKVYFVRLSNFDSHAKQADGDGFGQHWTLLQQVSSAITEFLDDAKQIGYADRVVGMTISEFGRRPFENGSSGTDHGGGSMQFVFAGNDKFINGGYYKEQGAPSLTDFDQYGNILKNYDFRRVYVDMLETWFKASKEETTAVFGEQITSLNILNPRDTSVSDSLVISGNVPFTITPNPTNQNTTISFELKSPDRVIIEIYSVLGQRLGILFNKDSMPGQYSVSLNRTLQSGSYLVNLRTTNRSFTQRLIVTK